MTLDEQKYIIGSNRNIGLSADSEKDLEKKYIQHGTEADIDHIESMKVSEKTPYTSKARRAQAGLKKHWRRFWCCYLLASIIFLAIFLPVL